MSDNRDNKDNKDSKSNSDNTDWASKQDDRFGAPAERDSYLARFEILRELALGGVHGITPEALVKRALAGARAAIGLSSARIIIWDTNNKALLNVTHSDSPENQKILDELEEDLFADLRRKRKLRSAFLSFAGDPAISSYTVPLYHKDQVFGAALGVRVGESGLIKEDYFLEAFAAAIVLATNFESVAKSGRAPGTPSDAQATQKQIDAERLKAVLETAVTLNHEINNPLTAALGNVQLILMEGESLDPAVRRKLEVVEKSAMQIRDVTQRLLQLTEARSVTYAGDETMIDISASKESKSKSQKSSKDSDKSDESEK